MTNIDSKMHYSGQQLLTTNDYSNNSICNSNINSSSELLINPNIINNNNNNGNNNGQMQYHDTFNNSMNSSSGTILNDYETRRNFMTTAPFTYTTTIDSTGNNGILGGNINAISGIATGVPTTAATIGCKSNQLHVPTPVLKKQGVSGESSDAANHQSNNIPIPKYEKDFRYVHCTQI